MQQQKLYIKGMVCDRCILSVKEELEALGVEIADVSLGEVTLGSNATVNEEVINEKLAQLGFSLLQDKKLKLVKDTKALVAEVYSGNFDFPHHFRFAHLASERLNTSYDALSAAFSSSEKTTIEKHIIDFKIEKVKELLVYSGSTLADISFALGFSSVAHLSKQFKLHTGLNPSYFREIKKRKELARSEAKKD